MVELPLAVLKCRRDKIFLKLKRNSYLLRFFILV